MVVLGLDLSLNSSGYAVVNGYDVLTLGRIAQSNNDDTPAKLNRIYQTLDEIILIYKPEVVVIEHAFVGRNAKTHQLLSMVHGVVQLLIHKYQLLYVYVTPREIKKALGDVKADKNYIGRTVRQLFNIPLDVEGILEREKKQDDMTDALAICYTFLNRQDGRTEAYGT